MNRNNICVFDFETGGLDFKVAPITQIGAVMLNSRTLDEIDTFDSLLKPENDEWEQISDKALSISNITKAMLQKAPPAKIVWQQFVSFVDTHNLNQKTLTPYDAPIPAGHNIVGFDMLFVDRYCKKYKAGWSNKDQKQRIFNRVYKIDLMDHMWMWMESNSDLNTVSLTNLMKYMGLSTDNAHNALYDAQSTAKIIKKLITLTRYLTQIDPATKQRRLNMRNVFNG